MYAEILAAVDWPSIILGPERTVPEEVAERHLVASADGTPIALYHWRHWKAGRPTILFMHANGFNAGCYIPFLGKLARRCNIFAVDSRGHGASGKPDPATPIEQRDYYAPPASGEDLIALRRKMGELCGEDVPIHFVSHSQGGVGGIIYAAAHGPEAFQSMTLFEPPLMPHGEPDRTNALRRTANFAAWAADRQVRFSSAEDFELVFNAIQTYRTFDAEMRRSNLASLIADMGDGFELRCPGTVEGKIYERNSAYPVPQLVAEVAVPGILYSADPAVSRAHGWYEFFQAICEPSPGLTARIMPGCRHLMIQENPEACAQAVLDQVFG